MHDVKPEDVIPIFDIFRIVAALCLITFYDVRIRNLLPDSARRQHSMTKDTQNLIPDADEQSEGEKDKMEPDDIGEGFWRGQRW